jgi:sugar phosphate isomerase/epimerase
MNMEYGICGGPDEAILAAQAGFDYFEWSVGNFLRPREGDDAFEAALAAVREAPLPCPTLNIFLPADLSICGPAVNQKAIEGFLSTTFKRARIAGIEVVGFGSGKARWAPDRFDSGKAFEQVAAFGRTAAVFASGSGVDLALEPLNRRECNIINSVARGAELVRAVDHPAFRLLVDGYHWSLENDSTEDIVANGDLIRHVHLATCPTRLAPGREAHDFSPFFAAVRQSGYQGRLSFEGQMPDNVEALAEALRIMREIEAA